MLRYVVKRVLLAILTVFIIAAITFFAMNAIPGGPFASEKAKDPAVEAMLMQRFHLAHGDFGISLKTGREISDVISESFSVSATLGGMAALLALIIGLVLGSIAALCRGRWPDRVIIFVTTLFVSVPSFILATILLLVFCLQLQWVAQQSQLRAACDRAGALSHGLYHPSDQIQHARRAGTGLHPHRPRQGRA